jgi:ubiquinone/menaquinone biosynthesis C-methylase UbiE
VLDALSSSLRSGAPDQLSLLDVGTGSADIPGAVAEWCRARGLDSMIVALDLSERNLRVSRNSLGISGDVQLIQADSLKLPFLARSFDFVTASLFLHHFEDADVVRLLADFARIAKRAVIINDLLRNLVPYYFSRVTGPILASSFLTRNDGPVSVLRGFTAEELKQLAERAGLKRCNVRRMFPYRLALIAEPHE